MRMGVGDDWFDTLFSEGARVIFAAANAGFAEMGGRLTLEPFVS